ncbi:PilW family protein, partial [Kingella kingae]|uniref:PilW family protein n=1 Tax=Kingella kingae TaxID=504 RepID=UPI001E5CBA47
MMNKQFISKPKGFTLIEFLVASSLAIIVISAAGGTYFMTRKLSDTTQKRLDIQQNLRNAASLLTRDARNAGTFGCFNTAIASGFDNALAMQGQVLVRQTKP